MTDQDESAEVGASARYPENQMWFGGSHIPVDPEFARLREEFLVDFKYATARAYWADLQDYYEWAMSASVAERSSIAPGIANAYRDSLEDRGFAASTVRRRVGTLRRFLAEPGRTWPPASPRAT